MRSRGKLIVSAALSCAVVAAAIVLGPRAYASYTLARQAEQGWRDLSHCLVGPIDADQSPRERVRLIALDAPGERRIGAPDAWPAHCRPFVDALHQTVQRLPPNNQRLVVSLQLEGLAPLVGDPSTLEERIDSLHEAARAADLVAAGGSSSPAAPPPSTPPAPLSRMRGRVIVLVSDPVARARAHFAVEASPVRLCEVAEDLRTARCGDLPADLEQPEREKFWGGVLRVPDIAPGAASHALIARRDEKRGLGEWRLVKPGGADSLTVGDLAWVSVAGERGIAWTHRTGTFEEDWVVERRTSDGREQEPADLRRLVERGARGKPPAQSTRPYLVGDWVFYHDGRGTRARRVLPASDPIGDPVDVLEGGAPDGWLSACASERGLALAVQRDHVATVLFEREGRWTGVEAGRGRFTFEPDDLTLPARLDCSGDEASFHWVDLSRGPEGPRTLAVLHRIRCTPKACDAWHSTPLDLAGTRQYRHGGQLYGVWVEAALATLGDHLLLASITRGGLRMRLAAPVDIATAPDRLVASEAANRLRLITGNGAVLALFATGENETAGLRIDATGAVEPLVEVR